MQNKLLNIYKAQKSKDAKRINITLIKGEDKEREYYTTSIELDNTKKAVQAQIKNGYVYVKIKVTDPDQKQTLAKADDIPY